MTRASLPLALASVLTWSAAPASAQDEGTAVRYAYYTPPSRSFACELPLGWTSYETETLRGIAVHMAGPRGAGIVRPSYHVHHFEKSRQGFLPYKDVLRRELQNDKASGRESSSPMSWRVGKSPGRMFEVREERLLPEGRLPAKPVRLHHFYAFVSSGADEYFMIKLSCPEEDFTEYRSEFRRFLKTFRVLGL